MKQIEDFLEMLKQFNAKVFEEWVGTVAQHIEVNLKQSLLKRNDNMELIMNFNPQVFFLNIF